MTMGEAGYFEEIIEDSGTIEGNAWLKANAIFDKTSLNVFGEDSGLEVQSLGGQPGVDTATYAGKERDNDKNIKKLLTNLEGVGDRSARFVTKIALIYNGERRLFVGYIKGTIAYKPKGESGFGYDPIFIPEGYTKTFAELGPEVKDTISHRSKAVSQLIHFLENFPTSSPAIQ
jgi:XTP/dITP diphosphohydrolase